MYEPYSVIIIYNVITWQVTWLFEMEENIHALVTSLTGFQIFWGPKSTGYNGPVTLKKRLVVYVTWIIYIKWHYMVWFSNRKLNLDLPSRSQLISALCESYGHSKSEIKRESISIQGIMIWLVKFFVWMNCNCLGLIAPLLNDSF